MEDAKKQATLLICTRADDMKGELGPVAMQMRDVNIEEALRPRQHSFQFVITRYTIE